MPRQSNVLYRFMRHNQGRSVDSVREVFYEGPASQVSTFTTDDMLRY